MGRRRSKGEPNIEQSLATLGGLAFLVLFFGLWRPFLLFVLILAGAILAAVFLVVIVRQSADRPSMHTPPPLPPQLPPADEIDVTCPQCKAVLVAPASMAGTMVTCEGCRHVFQLQAVDSQKPKAKLSNMTSFYFPPKPKGFSPALLHDLEWKRFENLVEGYFAAIGFKTRPNRVGADGGVDMHLLRPETGEAAAVVQCKSWHTYDVGVKPVRELYGVMAADRIPHGFFVTTGKYTSEARSWAAGKSLSLIDGIDLLRRLSDLPSEKQVALHAAITAGDYTTPTCPRCGCKMVRRQNRKNPFGGSDFWGCPSYPRCRQTLRIKKPE